jgi:DNA-binding response OmpR family regulator
MPRRSVALVEDEKAVAAMYRLGLERRGFEVQTYLDAPEFFQALDHALPNVVVLDWNLGTLTGGQILERLRMDDRTRDLRVLILSNMPRSRFADVVMSRLGVLAWLEKVKTTPADLAARVTHLFEEPVPAP